MTLIEYRGLLIRKSPVDREMIKDCKSNYSQFTFDKHSRVLDLGVFVGGFGKMALDAGVEAYLGVEADPENYEIATLNLKRYGERARLLKGAASMSTEPSLTFYQTGSGRSKCGGSVSVSNGARAMRPLSTTVENHNITELIESFKPTHLKMDIEGTEHDWFAANQGVIPDCIQQFACELHRFAPIACFAANYLGRIQQDFDMVHFHPAIGFAASSTHVFEVPEFNLRSTGTLYGVDLLFHRRK